jgi:hypothetical protein
MSAVVRKADERSALFDSANDGVGLASKQQHAAEAESVPVLHWFSKKSRRLADQSGSAGARVVVRRERLTTPLAGHSNRTV